MHMRITGARHTRGCRLKAPQLPERLPHLVRVLVDLGAHVGQQGQRRVVLPPLDGQENVGEARRLQRLLAPAAEFQAAEIAATVVAACLLRLPLDVGQRSEEGAGELVGAPLALLLWPGRVCLGGATERFNAVPENLQPVLQGRVGGLATACESNWEWSDSGRERRARAAAAPTDLCSNRMRGLYVSNKVLGS